MNLEQFYGSRLNLWVFLTTAIITLIFTGGSWLCVEQIGTYRKWRREVGPQKVETKYSRGVRLGLLVQVWKGGHKCSLWLWKLKPGCAWMETRSEL